MTVYTISEVLSQPVKVERSDKYYNASVPYRGDLNLLRKFATFASLPMEGASCALIWWLLHASGVNGDWCKPCHDRAVSIQESSLMQLSGTGKTTKKMEFSQSGVGDGSIHRRDSKTFAFEKCLKQKSCEQQRMAASSLLEFSSGCSMVEIKKEELEHCYIEQSEPLKAFAVSLSLWIGNQSLKTGWIRPFLLGDFAARQPRHEHLEMCGSLNYARRCGERLKTSVFRPALDYNRGFQWLAIQKIMHHRNEPDSYKASPIGVFSMGHVMRIYTSTDMKKEVILSSEEIQNSHYANRDWRVLDSWSNWAKGTGPYNSFSFNGLSARKVVFDSPIRLEGILLGGFIRHDDVWYSPLRSQLQLDLVDNVYRVSRHKVFEASPVHVTEDAQFG